MKKVDLTISTINYNVSNELKKCISSFLETYQDPNFTYEWFIFDNNSVAEEQAKFDELSKKYAEYLELKFIKKKENIGLAVLNSVLNEARGRYWLFLDPDTWQMGKPIPTLIEFMDSHPNVGISTALQYKPNGKISLRYGHSLNIFKFFINGTILGKAIDYFFFSNNITKFIDPHSNILLKENFQIYTAPLACTIERMELLKKDGYIIDPEFSFMLNDLDLCKRVRDKNYKIMIIPSAKIVHYGHSSYKKKKRSWERMTFLKAIKKYLRKYHKYQFFLYKFLLFCDLIFLILIKRVLLFIPIKNRLKNFHYNKDYYNDNLNDTVYFLLRS